MNAYYIQDRLEAQSWARHYQQIAREEKEAELADDMEKGLAQVQYSMWVTRKDAWYFANYDPRMKREGLHYVVVERDEKYIASFDEMVPEFIEKMDEALAEIGFVFGEQWR
ncbi:TPA: hypothetical protein HI064_17110 [Escherichia coli]|nr:hypothetical protein [Escherichia coli]